MNSMRSRWVKDLTLFFENLGKTNIRHSIKKKRDSKLYKIKPAFLNNYCLNIEKEITPVIHGEVNTSLMSENSEHCFKVKVAKDMFERMSSTDKSDIRRFNSSPLKKQVSVYDIFSGTATDLDIPPIEDDVEEDGVYPRAEIAASVPDNSASNNKHTNKPISMTSSSSSRIDSAYKLLIEKKKSVTKSPSYVDRKTQFKKGSPNFTTIASESDVEKENNGVIIRMKNQETYYDGRTKYKSLLPEVPLYPLVESKQRVRRSLFAQKAVDKSIDMTETNGVRRDNNVNSIMLREDSLPGNDSSHNVIDQICLEEDCNDSDELEPNEECDNSVDMKFPQLMTQGPQRIKWSETDEGKKLIRIKDLKTETIRWQEAQFEVITSEASYYRSLQILVNKIYKNPLMCCQGEKKQFSFNEVDVPDSVDVVSPGPPTSPSPQYLMTALQKHHLFSNILEIHICSEELLKALETRWRENPFIEDLSDILISFSKDKLRPYITYLRNQQYQTATYNQLLTKTEFQNVIKTIAADIDFGMMDLSSFLLLPMQRLLRLKLLFLAIRNNTPAGHPTQGCEAAIQSLEALIRECSDQKMLMEQKEEIMKIYNRLAFRQQTKVSIGNKPLLKDGQLRVSASNSKASRSLNSSFMKRNNNLAQLYLFEDQLIIAKTRKLPLCLSSADDREMVVDICPRSDIQFNANVTNKFFGKNCSNTVFKLVLVHGLKGAAEYTCEVDSRETYEQWENVFAPGANDWEQLEFNDVLVTKDYKRTSDKELDLQRGQILRIIRRIDDHRAIATSGDRQGEIPLSYVHFMLTPLPPLASTDLINTKRENSYCDKQ